MVMYGMLWYMSMVQYGKGTVWYIMVYEPGTVCRGCSLHGSRWEGQGAALLNHTTTLTPTAPTVGGLQDIVTHTVVPTVGYCHTYHYDSMLVLELLEEEQMKQKARFTVTI